MRRFWRHGVGCDTLGIGGFEQDVGALDFFLCAMYDQQELSAFNAVFICGRILLRYSETNQPSSQRTKTPDHNGALEGVYNPGDERAGNDDGTDTWNAQEGSPLQNLP